MHFTKFPSLFLLLPVFLSAQSLLPSARIVQPVQASPLDPIAGNVHPLAQLLFETGRAAPDLPADRMLLLLQGTPEQEAANQQLLRDQQDPRSPEYHHWLTPAEFGLRFGPAQQDIDTVTTWLRSHGLRVDHIANGRRVIEFSGTVAQVEEAFHTEIHRFTTAGVVHYANNQNPSIPAALTPVVTGIASLHSFFSKPQHRVTGRRPIPLQTAASYAPQSTAADGSHALAPADLATIYNFKGLWTLFTPPVGGSIAITARSNIDLNDLSLFHQTFRTSAITHLILNGSDPGNLGGNEELEADLDTEWAGAISHSANVNLVVSASTMFSDGIGLSAQYIVDNQLSQVITTSFGSCEADLGTSGNQFWASLWQQAATEGISVFVSTGDNGSAGCDGDGVTPPAQFGLAVNGLASTPYNVAVGGTQFNENGNDSLYWSSTNASGLQSALEYIPEKTWNESGPYSADSSRVFLIAGSGGVSSLYPTPAWQSAPGVPMADPANSPTPGQHHRYLPDLSLNAASGHDPYLVVQQGSLVEVGGTSASTPALAGIMVLLNVSNHQVAGLPTPRFYSLATHAPQVFHDTPAGSTNAVPCSLGTANCSLQSGTPTGITNGYNTTAGFDLATGLGSIDVAAIAQAWTTVAATSTVLTASPLAVLAGGSITFTASVTGVCQVSGSVLFLDGTAPLGTAPVSATTPASLAISSLSAGPHSITASFSGPSCASSTSAPVSVYIGEDAGATGMPLRFVPITPCRAVDTRNDSGPFGGPALLPQSAREFDLPASPCGIPSTALAYSLNVAALPATSLGYLTIFPSGQPQPVVSTLNSDGRVKANAAIVPAGSNGGVTVFVSDAAHVLLDVDGYFVPAATATSLAFYPLTPCRIVDTRNPIGPFGGPAIPAGSTRSFSLQAATCNVPAGAQAYSLNLTALPHGPLGWITAWPTGQPQPGSSTLNAYTGAVTANAALVPAGISGAVSIFASDSTDLLIDINGYFAPPTPGGLSLFTLTPCRILDTRSPAGSPPLLYTSTVAIGVSSCGVLPSAAQAFVLNATVVPPAPLGWLTLWPHGQSQPSVSTLNAYDAATTSNLVLVPTSNGSVDAFVPTPSNLILDLFAYFAP